MKDEWSWLLFDLAGILHPTCMILAACYQPPKGGPDHQWDGMSALLRAFTRRIPTGPDPWVWSFSPGEAPARIKLYGVIVSTSAFGTPAHPVYIKPEVIIVLWTLHFEP